MHSEFEETFMCNQNLKKDLCAFRILRKLYEHSEFEKFEERFMCIQDLGFQEGRWTS